MTNMNDTSDRGSEWGEVQQPKLDGHRVPMRARVFPDTHRRATLAARERGMSLSEYLALLVDEDTGVAHASRTAVFRQEALPDTA